MVLSNFYFGCVSDLSGSDSCGEIEPASRVSPPPAKQRMMRMYADDIEEELKAKR